jgi:hypothetical protein
MVHGAVIIHQRSISNRFNLLVLEFLIRLALEFLLLLRFLFHTLNIQGPKG